MVDQDENANQANANQANTNASSRIGASVATAGAVCDLGTDPAKFLEKFEDWYEHHSLLADTVGMQDNKKGFIALGRKRFPKIRKGGRSCERRTNTGY